MYGIRSKSFTLRMRSPSCRVPSFEASPVSVMCLIKIWLPSFSPYSKHREWQHLRLCYVLVLAGMLVWTSLTVCSLLFNQCSSNGLLCNTVRQPLVARRHQRQSVSVSVAVGGRAAASVLVVFSVVATVRIAARFPGSVRFQQVGMGRGPTWPGGGRDLNLSGPFHSLEVETEWLSFVSLNLSVVCVVCLLTTLAVLPHVLSTWMV